MRFELVDTNVGGDNNMITFDSDKRFGLVDVQRTDLEGNTAAGRKWEARGRCHHLQTWIFCQCPLCSNIKIMEFTLERLQSAECSFLITTLWENGC
jgi:hypothetical protein